MATTGGPQPSKKPPKRCHVKVALVAPNGSTQPVQMVIQVCAWTWHPRTRGEAMRRDGGVLGCSQRRRRPSARSADRCMQAVHGCEAAFHRPRQYTHPSEILGGV